MRESPRGEEPQGVYHWADIYEVDGQQAVPVALACDADMRVLIRTRSRRRRSICSNGCYSAGMAREISVRDLRNHTAEVVAAIRSGERLSLTVNRLPVADIVPHQQQRNAWLPSGTLRAIVEDAGADQELLTDLAAVRGALLDAP